MEILSKGRLRVCTKGEKEEEEEEEEEKKGEATCMVLE